MTRINIQQHYPVIINRNNITLQKKKRKKKKYTLYGTDYNRGKKIKNKDNNPIHRKQLRSKSQGQQGNKGTPAGDHDTLYFYRNQNITRRRKTESVTV